MPARLRFYLEGFASYEARQLHGESETSPVLCGKKRETIA